MLEHFKDLLAYTSWADGVMLANAYGWAEAPEACRKFLAHITAAQQEWLARVDTQRSRPESVWPGWGIAECGLRSKAVHSGWRCFLDTAKEERLAAPVGYNNLSGQPFSTPLQDILMHVVNHSTYHRAQVAMEARMAGCNVPGTDYIIYSRLKGQSPG